MSGNKQPTIDSDEHDASSKAKRVVVRSYNPGEASYQPFVQLDAAKVKFDASDASPTYIGVNADSTATDGATDWTLYKFTYSGSDVTQIVRKVGSWTDRATYF